MFSHHEDMKGKQNVEIVVVWMVQGHPRSLAILPFDRAHMTSCLAVIETMHHSCTFFKAIVSFFLSNVVDLIYLTCI